MKRSFFFFLNTDVMKPSLFLRHVRHTLTATRWALTGNRRNELCVSFALFRVFGSQSVFVLSASVCAVHGARTMNVHQLAQFIAQLNVEACP